MAETPAAANMMGDPLVLDPRWSTTRRLFCSPAGIPPLAPADRRHGGLRHRGYVKMSAPGRPLVTVVTVVRNHAQALSGTITSVLEQTYDNIEFIVIDGASTDATPELIAAHDPWIDCWISEPDRGIFDAMNKGIALARGEYINFMNAGDRFYRPETVASVFGRDTGGADFIYGHTDFLGGDFRGVVKAWDLGILWKTMVFTHQSLFTRRTVLAGRGFDTRFRICADYEVIFNGYMSGLNFFNSDTVIASFDPGFSEVSRSRMAFEKWRVIRRHRRDLAFHAFYLKLFVKRFFRDWANRRRRKRQAGRD
jgi:glycosyltransferase involved in cell wall biosynthesis